MLKKPKSCLGCVLYDKGQGFSSPAGTADNGVAIIGESLGEQEVRAGEPFVGDAGLQLNRSIERGGHDRQDFSIYNLIQCRPPNNFLDGAPWENEAIEFCKTKHLLPWIRANKPRVLSLQGALATRKRLNITGLLPSKRNNAPKRGYIYDCIINLGNGESHSCKAVPTLHPSYIIRGNQNLAGVHLFDINRAVRVATEGEDRYTPEYHLDPSLGEFETFIQRARDRSLDYLVADIETAESSGTDEESLDLLLHDEIVRISFSFNPGSAITLPFNGATKPLIQKIST